jgi:hypothetical protein
MRCGVDSLTTEQTEQCASGCTDGTCATACEPNLLASCGAACPNAPLACYDLCKGPAKTAMPPLIDAAAVTPGQDYVIQLPAFDVAPSCACDDAKKPYAAAVAYKLPQAPVGLHWRVTVAAPWLINIAKYQYLPNMSRGNGCELSGVQRHCLTWQDTGEAILWVATEKVSPTPITAVVTLAPDGQLYCE